MSDLVKVVVDETTCIAGGICEMLEPDTFTIDDDSAISVVQGEGLVARDRAEVVVDRCPARAVSIVEAATEEPTGAAGAGEE